MENISPHISYTEATKSNTATRNGIDNNPDECQLENMTLVAEQCFEPLRNHHGKAIGISSFFRSVELNTAIGGSKTSQHCAGIVSGVEEAAIDIDADMYNTGITNAEIYYWLRDNVVFDQLIWEFGNDTEPNWVHVSCKKWDNRHQLLKAVKIDGKTKYQNL